MFGRTGQLRRIIWRITMAGCMYIWSRDLLPYLQIYEPD